MLIGEFMKKVLLATLFASLFILTSPILHAKTYGESSIKELKALAANGDVTAMGALGDKYAEGEGVKTDYAEAVKWMKKAAEQGDEDAKEAIPLIESLMK